MLLLMLLLGLLGLLLLLLLLLLLCSILSTCRGEGRRGRRCPSTALRHPLRLAAVMTSA
jgi:hypothetical protein